MIQLLQPTPIIAVPTGPRPPTFSEECAVCGDQSTGYHYDVPSCNGCKTFFRRTIVTGRRFECSKGGRCQLEKNVRCSCRACRFSKCIAVGMNSKAIQHSRGTSLSPPSSAGGMSGAGAAPELSAPGPVRAASVASTASIPSISVCARVSMIDKKKSVYNIDTILGMTELGYVQENSSDLIARLQSLEQNYAKVSSSHFPSSSVCLLDRLTKPSAFDAVCEPTTSSSPSPSPQCDWLDAECATAVEYAKAFRAVTRLDLTDKISLLSSAVPSMVVLSAARRAALSGSTLPILPGGDTLPRGDTRAAEQLVEAVRRARVEPTAYALLKAIVLLNTENYALSPSARRQLDEQRQTLVDALNQHVFDRSPTAGPTQMCELISLCWATVGCGVRFREHLIGENKPEESTILLTLIRTAQIPFHQQVIRGLNL